jgi:hypothetical protein
MDDDVKNSSSFQYIKQTRSELDSLVMGRNELARWYKKNNAQVPIPKKFHHKSKKAGQISFSEFGKANKGGAQEIEDIVVEESKTDDEEEPLLLHYPPMIKNTSECKYCYQRKVCTLAALSIEDPHPLGQKRTGNQGNFPTFLEL